jgi:hypothetical protein
VDQQLALDNRIQRETVIPPEVCDWLMMADARLTQCNVVVQFSESAQKTANGKNRPVAVLPGWTANVRFWAPIAWADEVTSRARHEGSQSRQEVKWLEQELGGAIAKGAFELVDNEAVAVGAQAIDRQRGSGDGATQPLELLSLDRPYGPRIHEIRPVESA